MELITSVEKMRELGFKWRAENKAVGLVPTMGYLHDGHLSLANFAVRDNDLTVMTIFVNPIQFGANEDLDTYPRDLTGDLEKAASVGVDYVFAPEAKDMYPEGFATSMDVAGVSETLCGASRPGHFQGVTVVLTKLFNLVQPTRAYFGQKDGQQLAVIKKFVKDLNFPVEIVGIPIKREADGLAMSSRNTYLDEECRAQAPVLNQALRKAGWYYGGGESDSERLIGIAREIIETAPLAEIEYIQIVDAETMQPIDYIDRPVMMAVAVRFKGTRLIDNIIFA